MSIANLSGFIQAIATAAPAIKGHLLSSLPLALLLLTLGSVLLLFKPLLNGLWYASKLYIKQSRRKVAG